MQVEEHAIRGFERNEEFIFHSSYFCKVLFDQLFTRNTFLIKLAELRLKLVDCILFSKYGEKHLNKNNYKRLWVQ